MPNRVISESILYSKKIGSLTYFQQTMFVRLLVTVDDSGRYYADPVIVKNACYPLKQDITLASIRDALDRMENAGIIERYSVNDETFLRIIGFEEMQSCGEPKNMFPEKVVSQEEILNRIMSGKVG